MSGHILLVDDDALMRRGLAFNLEQAGYHVTSAANAEDALDIVRRTPPDIVLLDIGLPGMDGLDALRHVKEEFGLPVIFLTARRRELDEIVGLELGADDYITKPFNVDVLLARVKAVLRQREKETAVPPTQKTITIGDLKIDPKAHTVNIAGREIDLTPREFDLLYALAQEPGRVQSIDDLLAQVWVQNLRASRRWCTSIFAGCAKKSRPIPEIQRASSPFMGWAIDLKSRTPDA